MSESPKLFTQYEEVLCRQDFDSTIAITTSNFERLISPYRFGNDVICQVEKATGRCGHKHLSGWVGRIQGGKEGLIGGHCAKTYFKGDSRFISEQRRIRQEMDFQEAEVRLRRHLGERDVLLAKIQEVLARFRRFKTAARELERQLPPRITAFLRDGAKTGNVQVGVELRYVEKDEEGKEIVRWLPHTIGLLQGLGIWLDVNHSTISGKAKEIEAVAKVATFERSAGLRKLQGWLKTLDELPIVEDQVSDLFRQLDAFTNFSNLCRLIFLLRDEAKQVQVAEFALAVGRNSANAKREAPELRKLLYKEIKTANHDRDFKGSL